MQRQKPSHRWRQYIIFYLDADAVGTAFSGKENNEFKPRAVETPIQVAPTDAAFLNPITQQEIVRPSNTIIE